MSNKKEKSKTPAIDPNEAPETMPEIQTSETGSEPNETPEVKELETTKSAPKGKTGDTLPEFLAPYRKAYPKCRAFHVTSDRMVFLEGDRNAALVHQKSIGEGTVETFKMKDNGKTER